MFPDPKAILNVTRLVKRFGGFYALDGLSFHVASGEILGLVGPNGSGKTTAINVVSGLYAPDGGEVVFDGASIGGVASHRLVHRGINRTFQVPKVFRDMTARENIEVAARAVHLPMSEIDPILHDIGLLELASRNAGSLTVNQQKLLDLGRALATRPKLLLVDEIGAGLSPAELHVIADLLKKLSARGIAMVVVEHLLEFLNRITERVIVLGAGRMLFEGPLSAASRDPEVIAAFIGVA